MAERKPARKDAEVRQAHHRDQEKAQGITDEERDAMRERAQELKAATRRGPARGQGGRESAVLAKIAETPKADRAMAERLHAIVKASAPILSPRTWYGMPAYAKDGKVVCFFPKRAEVQDEVRDARLQRQGEPRRRHHVADRRRSEGTDRRRRQDRRAREESSELRTELATSPRARRDRRSGRGVPPGKVLMRRRKLERTTKSQTDKGGSSDGEERRTHSREREDQRQDV
jgi:uncharacterized protein YdhG (YjbR/CyaY superfamily)